jgi:hypothetical protein
MRSDEEFHGNNPIYCTNSMKMFFAKEDFDASNPRPSTRNIGGGDDKGNFAAVPSTPAGPVTVEMKNVAV